MAEVDLDLEIFKAALRVHLAGMADVALIWITFELTVSSRH